MGSNGFFLKVVEVLLEKVLVEISLSDWKNQVAKQSFSPLSLALSLDTINILNLFIECRGQYCAISTHWSKLSISSTSVDALYLFPKT